MQAAKAMATARKTRTPAVLFIFAVFLLVSSAYLLCSGLFYGLRTAAFIPLILLIAVSLPILKVVIPVWLGSTNSVSGIAVIKYSKQTNGGLALQGRLKIAHLTEMRMVISSVGISVFFILSFVVIITEEMYLHSQKRKKAESRYCISSNLGKTRRNNMISKYPKIKKWRELTSLNFYC